MSDMRRPAADLIEAVLENMRTNLEELRYSTVAPSRYTVYLSPREHARLEGILPRLRAETIRALNEELARLNKPSLLEKHLGGWVGKARLKGRPALQNSDTHWHVEFLPDVDGDLHGDQDIVVHSDLVLPAEPELGTGERTRRITTVRTDQGTTSRSVLTTATASTQGVTAGTAAYARLSYEDASGRHQFDITQDVVTIGRGGSSHRVDLKIVTSEDVSREHARIRRDAGTGAFFLIDLSSLGTTLNGRHVPRGYDEIGGARRPNGAESQLPDRARIGLAETVFLDFERR